jgi:phospholipid/cholesterol/gamma-HCH transport system substrate-binding protein
MDSVLTGIQLVFNEENRTNLSESFTSVNRTLINLESASRFLNEYVVTESKRVTSLLGSVDTLGRDLMNRSADIRGIISNMNRFSDTLANLQVSEVVTILKRVLFQIDLISSNLSAGQGSLGRLLADDSLYQALLATNGALSRLIEDIRINPGKYVHVGIVNKTRPIYAVNDSDLAKVLGGEGTSPYYVCIYQTTGPPGSGKPLPEGIQQDRFIQIGQEFYYYQFKSSRIESCIRRITKARLEFPSAGIFTWVNGQWMRLEI